MKKTLFGRTGLEISEIAFGGGTTGGVLINADEATRWAVLDAAVKAGVNWIDTAPLYGNGASEETIGRHLSALSPQPHVSTKVRIERDDMGDIPGAIGRSIEASLKRLQTDRIALLQLHNQLGQPVGDRPSLSAQEVLGRGGVADAFDRLKEQGIIIASGITAAGETDACLDVIESGRFDAAQVYYNVLNPTAAWLRPSYNWPAQDFAGIVPTCWRLNMGTLAIRVWAGGVLASAQRPERLTVFTSGTDLDNEMRCADAVRAALGEEYGTPAQAALRFALVNKDISSRVLGISDLAQLQEAVAAVEMGPLPPDAIARLEALWTHNFQV